MVVVIHFTGAHYDPSSRTCGLCDGYSGCSLCGLAEELEDLDEKIKEVDDRLRDLQDDLQYTDFPHYGEDPEILKKEIAEVKASLERLVESYQQKKADYTRLQ